MSQLTFGSLFAGIGGFDLGFERAGMRCVWQVEIDPFCRKVLAKHWPDVRRWDDVRTFPPEPKEDWHCDVICGGFPCQDISHNGHGAGIGGERSGLWAEYARIVRVVRPRFVVVENVAALANRGLDRVLGDLAACGYDAEWDCIPAAAVGAPHRRDRLFVVAHSDRVRRQAGNRIQAVLSGQVVREPSPWGGIRHRSAGGRVRIGPPAGTLGVADGVPNRVDRLRGLGNAVVPQVAEWIGRRIMDLHAR